MTEFSVKGLFQPTVILALALMTVIAMMIIPMPAWVLDIGLATSFALAILIFTVTLFIEKPLEFSSFPTILLASLMLRLSLNVSSTKLIIGYGHTGAGAAGDVIEGFAKFVMGGSVFLGLVIFGVLLIVNFVVITKGAARMAEVGARFALDGMPGKQLAIDSDLSAGAINHDEARERRVQEQQETTFFGSLDGASKFVKGDAIAGLLITLLNLVVGLAMGVAVHGMPFKTAFETYTILTVGDGLVTQIPAVIISIASALLLARGGTPGATDLALTQQLGRYPVAMVTVSVLMVFFALIPGLPFLPFIIGGCILGITAYFLWKAEKNKDQPTAISMEKASVPVEKSMGDVLELDDIHIEFAPDLINSILDPSVGLGVRIENMRRHVAETFGLVLPQIRLTDEPGLEAGTYVIRILGVEQARAQIRTDHVLVLHPGNDTDLAIGEYVKEPVFGAPARWIPENAQDKAALDGVTVVLPLEILSTHLLEAIKKNLSRLLTLKAVQRILDEMVNLSDQARSEANRKLLDEIIPDRVPAELLHSVLRLLLKEQVSIRNLPLILEAIAEGRQISPQADIICEHVRQRLGFQIVANLRHENGSLPLIQLAPEWEDTFSTYQIDGDRGNLDIALPPELFNSLATAVSEQVSKATNRGFFPAIVTSTARRRFLHSVLSAKNISNPVLSFEEIGLESNPALVGVVAA